MGILWIILIGFVAGIIARLLSSGPNNPSGFILTTVLGVGGAFLATFLGQLVGWYRPDQGAGFIGAKLAPSSFSLSGIGSWQRVSSRILAPDLRLDTIAARVAPIRNPKLRSQQ
jgi:uncharacterized membrane protein YeaQ/YmgE (transglycosylase-associated protein family)